ncbi:MAG TPA: hypothetical protein VHW00_23850 [Thermoanaerobaculia bacterium]|nr:hypothetical protein [Thermoanaerobaculia bacterium]
MPTVLDAMLRDVSHDGFRQISGRVDLHHRLTRFDILADHVPHERRLARAGFTEDADVAVAHQDGNNIVRASRRTPGHCCSALIQDLEAEKRRVLPEVWGEGLR